MIGLEMSDYSSGFSSTSSDIKGSFDVFFRVNSIDKDVGSKGLKGRRLGEL